MGAEILFAEPAWGSSRSTTQGGKTPAIEADDSRREGADESATAGSWLRRFAEVRAAGRFDGIPPAESAMPALQHVPHSFGGRVSSGGSPAAAGGTCQPE